MAPKDRRFKDEAWEQNPAFRRLLQAYLATGRTIDSLICEADLDWRSEAVRLSWQPGDTLAKLDWSGGRHAVLKVTPATSGFRIRYRGADVKVLVLRPHVAQYLKHMPVKVPPDMSRARDPRPAESS